jgi:hypothetical protein
MGISIVDSSGKMPADQDSLSVLKRPFSILPDQTPIKLALLSPQCFSFAVVSSLGLPMCV